MRKFFKFVLRLLGIKKHEAQPKADHSPAKVELKDEVKTPTWENPEPFKAEEKVSIFDEVVLEATKVEEEKKREEEGRRDGVWCAQQVGCSLGKKEHTATPPFCFSPGSCPVMAVRFLAG